MTTTQVLSHINMHHIIQRDVSPLRNRATSSHPNRHVGEVSIRTRQGRKVQRLILRSLRRIAQAHRRHLLASHIEPGDRDRAALRETLGGARISAEAEVEGLEREGFHAGAALELRVRVEG